MIYADEFVAFVYVRVNVHERVVLLIESERVESSRRRRTLPKKKSAFRTRTRERKASSP